MTDQSPSLQINRNHRGTYRIQTGSILPLYVNVIRYVGKGDQSFRYMNKTITAGDIYLRMSNSDSGRHQQ